MYIKQGEIKKKKIASVNISTLFLNQTTYISTLFLIYFSSYLFHQPTFFLSAKHRIRYQKIEKPLQCFQFLQNLPHIPCDNSIMVIHYLTDKTNAKQENKSNIKDTNQAQTPKPYLMPHVRRTTTTILPSSRTTLPYLLIRIRICSLQSHLGPISSDNTRTNI